MFALVLLLCFPVALFGQSKLTSPAPGGTLASSSVTFTWTAGATEFDLWLGLNGPGSSGLYNSGLTTATSATVANLPSKGAPIYARLFSEIGGVWYHSDYTYTEAALTPAALTSPTPGSKLGISEVTFSWTPGIGVTNYALWLGLSGPGSSSLYSSGLTSRTSATITSLSAKGATVYARLFSEGIGGTQYVDYTFKEQSPPAVSALSCSSASITGSGSVPCSVTLDAPAVGALTVELSSNNSAVTLPATISVPANASGAGFIAVISSVGSPQTVILEASAGGISKTAPLQLTPGTRTLSIDASSVAFGNVEVNTLATQSVILKSTGTAPVIISAATLTGAGFAMSAGAFPITLTPNETATLSFEFNPKAVGAATGSITIASNSSTGTPAVIGLSGTGTSPYVELSWDAPSSSADPVVTYSVYRAPAGSSSFQLLGSSGEPQTAYVDRTVQSGQTYDYIVESVDDSGAESTPSNMISVTIP
ncbi:MAG: choice-of-anchor D domain-containing protein [Terracidiphilus sp.]